MKDRFLRKYKKEVSDQSVNFFDYCHDKVSKQLDQKGCDDSATHLLANFILHSNGIFKGVSVKEMPI